MMAETVFLPIITLLVGIVGYFVKKTYDRVDTMGNRVDDISRDLFDVKSKVDILWQTK